MRIRILSMVVLVLFGVGLGLSGEEAPADKIPALAKISATLPETEQKAFQQREMDLHAAFNEFKMASGPFNKKAAKDQSDEAFATLKAQRARYVAAVIKYNDDLALRVAAAERRRVIKAMNAYVHPLDWSAQKKKRVATALNKLGDDGNPEATSAQAREAWRQILARLATKDWAVEASQGHGPVFPGAGTQGHQDCAVFALANAAGLPYGLVAARAADLISKAEWREANERATPEQTIARGGLNGGEVIILAEAFGQVEVKSKSAFAAILKGGHPVLINVVPSDGNWDSGHEVILSRTFQHAGETWYEMMDSNQPPETRLYLSGRELNTILQEKGVVFRPEKGRVPKLLRSGK